jgi:uncharacterized protein (DUF2384 family)
LSYGEPLDGPGPGSAEQLAEELAHPNAAIWNRAIEIYGEETKARSWMKHATRSVFDGRTPEELIQTGDLAHQLRVLEVLIRIDYGVFSCISLSIYRSPGWKC